MFNLTADKSTGVYDWFLHCEASNLILCFKGDFNQDLVNAILLLAETKDEYHNNQAVVRARVFSVMVESMQNICRYGAAPSTGEEMKPGIVLVGKQDNKFFIQTGNLILNEEVEALDKRLEGITSMGRDELKVMHKKQMKEATFNQKSGAGLGFINMARKAEKLSYRFNKLDDKVSFFAFEAIVSASE